MGRPRIVLDCDPGIDDAFAILCALRYCDLVAVTTVSGNAPIEHTTRNALHVLELAASPVPVHQGAGAPLVARPAFAESVHGAAGLGDEPTPPPHTRPASTDAVAAIAHLLEREPLSIVATGPLTNIARLVAQHPDLTERVPRIFWMGGSTEAGNTTTSAEFNSWADPHAVAAVFASGVPVTMFGLNLTRQVRVGADHAERLRAAATPTSLRAAVFLEFYESHGVRDGLGQPMHDPCAVLGASHSDVFTVAASNIVVHTSDDDSRGRTEVRESADERTQRVDVAARADATAAIDLILAAAADPRPSHNG